MVIVQDNAAKSTLPEATLKNLLGRLMSRPFDELKAIANAWGTLTRDPNPTQNDLAIAAYHTMVDRSAVRGVWSYLDPEARAFISWLLGQRNMLALIDDLPALLDEPPEEASALVERTRRLGLVDVDEVLVRGSRVVSSGDNLYAWASRNQSEAVRRKVVSVAAEAAKLLRDVIDESKRPAPFEEPFAILLQGLEQEEVQRIASTWKLPDASRYYKSELIGVMSEFLATGQGRDLLLSSLSQASRELFSYLEAGTGKENAIEIKTHFEWGERELRTALVPLVQRALVWDVLSADRRYLFVPRDIVKGAGEPIQISPGLLPKLTAPEPYATDTALPYEMPWDLLTLLASASQQQLSLTLQDGRVTKRLAKKVNESFLHPDELKAGTEYIDILVHFARSIGLLADISGEQPTLAITAKSDEWASLSFSAQRHRMFAFWQGDRKWTEPAAYGTIYWWNSDFTGARKRLVQHVLDLPATEWISLEGFLRKIHLAEPFLIWSQDELVKRFGLRALQGFRSQWFEIEGRIVADMIRTMLYWLGAVDIGRDKQKRFVSFRVTQAGRELLDPEHIGESQAAPAKSLLVQPNFEVLVLDPRSSVLWNLIRMADLVRHDRVSVYVLNKESVSRAIEAGISPEDMIRVLEQNGGKDLPQNVSHSIMDWARLAKRLTVSQVILLEVDEPVVLDELVSSRKTRKLVLRRLSPTVALAMLGDGDEPGRDDPLQRYLKELRAAGYLPKLAPAEGQQTLTVSKPMATSLENGRAKRAPNSAGQTAKNKKIGRPLHDTSEEAGMPPTRTGTS